MTLDEIKQSDKCFLVPNDISEVLACDPQLIRVAARDCPEQLGFPVTRVGTRTKIPRIAFINYVEGREDENEEQDA